MADLSSMAASTQNPPSVVVSGGAVKCRHMLVRTPAASVVKWHPEPKLHKLQLLSRPHQTGDLPPHMPPLSEDAVELASPLLFFKGISKDDFFMTSELSKPLFLSCSVRQTQESSERDDFYANMGSAIRTLREETPFLFYKDLNYSIYRDDITFRDPRNMFTGIDKYRLIFWALRFHGQMFFKAIWVEVLRIWQPSDRVIIVRWTVRGIPRVPWEAQGLFEGTSEYKLDEKGKIYEHKVDNVAPNNPSYFRTPNLLSLLPSSPSATPTPTFFKRTALLLWMELITAKGSTWEWFYFALTTTLHLEASAHRWILYLPS